MPDLFFQRLDFVAHQTQFPRQFLLGGALGDGLAALEFELTHLELQSAALDVDRAERAGHPLVRADGRSRLHFRIGDGR